MNEIKIPTWAAAVALASMISFFSWTALQIIALKENVAGLSARVESLSAQYLVKH